MVLFSSTLHALNRRYEPAKYQVGFALVISAADEKELRFFQLSKKTELFIVLAAFSDRININSLILIILHSMQSAILDDKSSPRAYPRDKIAVQARCAEWLNHVGFWQASHRF
jgi:hypothetical protein